MCPQFLFYTISTAYHLKTTQQQYPLIVLQLCCPSHNNLVRRRNLDKQPRFNIS
jgi:hypothetical protein